MCEENRWCSWYSNCSEHEVNSIIAHTYICISYTYTYIYTISWMCEKKEIIYTCLVNVVCMDSLVLHGLLCFTAHTNICMRYTYVYTPIFACDIHIYICMWYTYVYMYVTYICIHGLLCFTAHTYVCMWYTYVYTPIYVCDIHMYVGMWYTFVYMDSFVSQHTPIFVCIFVCDIHMYTRLYMYVTYICTYVCDIHMITWTPLFHSTHLYMYVVYICIHDTWMCEKKSTIPFCSVPLRILKPMISLSCDMAIISPPADVNPEMTGCGTKFITNPSKGAAKTCITPDMRAIVEA